MRETHHLYRLDRADYNGNSLSACHRHRRHRRRCRHRSWDVLLLILIAVTTMTTTIFLPVAVALTSDSTNHHHHNNNYGADVSFPMHQDHVTTNYDWLPHNTLPQLYKSPEGYVTMPIQPLGNRQEAYSEYIRGCIEFYEIHGRKCLDTERDRINRNKRQPQSMVNYTHEGFFKTRAPDEVWRLVSQFWNRNKEQWVPEQWPIGNSYTNHWSAPSYIVSAEDELNLLRGGSGNALKTALWKAAQQAVEEWTQQEVSPMSLYGIRVSTSGAILAPHVDGLPLVTSVILNVAQDVDDHWPLEVIGHDGYAHNITLDPGEMLLYESHSIIHGRPFPLKGKYMANLYLHFEPTGHSWKHHDFNHDQSATPLQYQEAVQKGAGGHEAAEHPTEHSIHLDHETDLPVYLIPNSPEVKHYRKLQQRNDQSSHATSDEAQTNTNSHFVPTDAHALARDGKVEELYSLLEEGGDHLVHAKDSNGWQPLHESARAGHLTVVQLLVAKGASINERTHNGDGGTPLYYASLSHGVESLVAKFLQSHGAVSIIPIDEL